MRRFFLPRHHAVSFDMQTMSTRIAAALAALTAPSGLLDSNRSVTQTVGVR
jgi:hypothetical protein